MTRATELLASPDAIGRACTRTRFVSDPMSEAHTDLAICTRTNVIPLFLFVSAEANQASGQAKRIGLHRSNYMPGLEASDVTL